MSQPTVYQVERVYLRGGPADDTFQRIEVNKIVIMVPTDAGAARYAESQVRTPGGERIFDYDSGVILP